MKGSLFNPHKPIPQDLMERVHARQAKMTDDEKVRWAVIEEDIAKWIWDLQQYSAAQAKEKK